MRVKSGKARNRSKKRLFKAVKGNVGGRRKLLRTATETLIRAGVYAYAHRRLKKRDFRSLWITRLSAACRERGMSYSAFIHGLSKSGITLNRKSLSELAIHHPDVFTEVVDAARAAAS